MKHIVVYLTIFLALTILIIGCSNKHINESTKSIPLGRQCDSNSDCQIIKCHKGDSHVCTYQSCVNLEFPLQGKCDDNCAIEEILPKIKCECINNVCQKIEK